MDLKTLSVTELKALAYDQLALLEVTQQNIQLINKELKDRANASSQAPIVDKVSEG